MICWKCHKTLEALEKISFHTSCPFCHSDLHVCVNCRYFAQGKPHDCEIPDIEPVSDKEKRNFCEEFRVKSPGKDTKNSSPIKKIFSEDIPPKKDFDSLF